MVKLKRELSGQISDILRKRVTTLEIEPGVRVDIQKLSREFQVSASPIKRALRDLSQRGLILNKPGGSYYVATLCSKKIDEIYDLRRLYECEALNTAIYRMSAKKLEEFKRKMEELPEHQMNHDMKKLIEFYRVDQALHCEIIKKCKNETLKKYYDYIYDFVKISQHFHMTAPKELDKHILIIETILKKDLPEAKTLLEKHIIQAKEMTVRALEKEASPWKESSVKSSYPKVEW